MSLKLTYTSSGGTVEMTGGAPSWTSGVPQLRIKEITGLGLAETECRTVSYAIFGDLAPIFYSLGNQLRISHNAL